MDYSAQTEYCQLRKVLMHRTFDELKQIPPGNKEAYLFRDVVYWRAITSSDRSSTPNKSTV